jgi:hypothetical protein
VQLLIKQIDLDAELSAEPLGLPTIGLTRGSDVTVIGPANYSTS